MCSKLIATRYYMHGSTLVHVRALFFFFYITYLYHLCFTHEYAHRLDSSFTCAFFFVPCAKKHTQTSTEFLLITYQAAQMFVHVALCFLFCFLPATPRKVDVCFMLIATRYGMRGSLFRTCSRTMYMCNSSRRFCF